MIDDYKMYKFYNGEDKIPENLTVEQARLYDAERTFEEDFRRNDSADWFSLFKDCEKNGKNAGKLFIKKLAEDENEKPAEKSKNWIFKLWLDYYLFIDKLPAYFRKIYEKGV